MHSLARGEGRQAKSSSFSLRRPYLWGGWTLLSQLFWEILTEPSGGVPFSCSEIQPRLTTQQDPGTQASVLQSGSWGSAGVLPTGSRRGIEKGVENKERPLQLLDRASRCLASLMSKPELVLSVFPCYSNSFAPYNLEASEAGQWECRVCHRTVSGF